MKYRFVRRVREKHYILDEDKDILDIYVDLEEETVGEYDLDTPLSVGDEFMVTGLKDAFIIHRIIKTPENVTLCYIRDRIVNIQEAVKERVELVNKSNITINPKVNPKTNMFLKALNSVLSRK